MTKLTQISCILDDWHEIRIARTISADFDKEPTVKIIANHIVLGSGEVGAINTHYGADKEADSIHIWFVDGAKIRLEAAMAANIEINSVPEELLQKANAIITQRDAETKAKMAAMRKKSSTQNQSLFFYAKQNINPFPQEAPELKMQ